MGLKSVKELEKNAVELEIQIEKKDFDEAVTKVFKRNVGKMNVPGFRRGKAPRNIIEKMYGKGVFYDDALNDILPDTYTAALEESNVKAVSRPEFDIVSIDENGVFVKAKLYKKPEVEINNYFGITAEREVEEVTPEMVDAELERVRARNARMVDITDRAAQKDDIVTIDFDGYSDGEQFEGGKSEGYELKLGSGQFIPGFEDQVIGKNAGDEFDVNVTFPNEYHADSLAGKPAVFKVKLHAIKYSELPEADDEFVKDVSEFDTLAEYKADVRAKMLEKNNKAADEAAEAQIIDGLLANMTADIPLPMIEGEVDNLIRDYENSLRMQGMDMNTFFKYTGMDIQKMREQFEPKAERQVRVRLALEKIVELEKIEVSKEEIDAEFENIAKAYSMKVEDVRASINDEGIKADVAVGKAVNLIKEKAVITEKKPEEKAEAKDSTDKTAEKKAKPASAVKSDAENDSKASDVKSDADKPTKKKTAKAADKE